MAGNKAKAKKKTSFFKRRERIKEQYYDYNLLAIIVLLICFGLIMLYSTSAYISQITKGTDLFYFKRQAIISGVSLIGVLFISRFDYHLVEKIAPVLFFLSFILLLLTPFLGREANGATRWIYFGPVSFQPAELAKLSVIILMPYMIERMGKGFGRGHKRVQTAEVKNGTKLKDRFLFWLVKGFDRWTSVILVMTPAVLLSGMTFVLTKNLSSAIIIAGIGLVILFIAHPKMASFLVVGGVGFSFIGVFVWYVANHMNGSGGHFRMQRIITWLAPEQHMQGIGYQTMQALYAIGSGGFFGKGLGNSAQKLGAVPEAQNDMIFSIICEELGVFGAAMLTLLFIFLLYRLFFIAKNARDLYGSLLVAGIFAHIALQVILNIAVVTNTIPNTGITLPFVSYGGTSVVFLMGEMALALSVSRQIQLEENSQ